MRIARRHGQRMTIESNRDHPIKLRHRFGQPLQQFFGNWLVAQRHHLHVHLLAQRLSQLIVRNQRHVFSNFAEQRPRLLLLFVQQQLQLLIRDKPHIDEDLTDASSYHLEITFALSFLLLSI